MKAPLSSPLALAAAGAAIALALLSGCDRRASDVPLPTTNDMERDRTTNPSMPPAVPAVPAPDATPAPPASDPSTPPAPPLPGGASSPGSTTQ